MMDTVYLTQAQFDALPEYSCTDPTGTTIGKQWKMGRPYIVPRTAWYLREYVADENPKMVTIISKRILIEGHTDPALWPQARPMPVELL